MNKQDMSFEEAREYLLANYFDGDGDTTAFVAGDEESVVMAKAVEALTKCINLNNFEKMINFKDNQRVINMIKLIESGELPSLTTLQKADSDNIPGLQSLK